MSMMRKIRLFWHTLKLLWNLDRELGEIWGELITIQRVVHTRTQDILTKIELETKKKKQRRRRTRK